MSKAFFLRETQLERLRQNIKPNTSRYSLDKPWLDDYFGAEAWHLPSSVEMTDGVQLKEPESKTELFDLENTKAVYLALKHLTPLQACDERLWTYLTHVTFWTYMRKRWPAEQYHGKRRFVEVMEERYFFTGHRARALIRNGISRLWWYGYATYDDTRQDPFELTAVLLKRLDVTQSILERTFSHNRAVTRTVLSVLLQREKDGVPFYDRDDVRKLAGYLVQVGGVTIIDALTLPDVQGLVDRKVSELTAAVI